MLSPLLENALERAFFAFVGAKSRGAPENREPPMGGSSNRTSVRRVVAADRSCGSERERHTAARASAPPIPWFVDAEERDEDVRQRPDGQCVDDRADPDGAAEQPSTGEDA